MKLEFNLEEVKRFYLKSHFLLNKAPQNNLLKVVGEICGLNAQTARAPYLSLWSRIKGFEKDQLTKAFYKDKLLVKTWLMRGTVHIIPVQDFAFYQKALQRRLVEDWQRILKRHGLGLSAQKRTKLHQSILDILEEASLTKRELLPEVRYLMKGYSEKEQKIILSRTLRELSYQGLICHGKPTGSWYHFKENRFTGIDNWLNRKDFEKMDEMQAKRKLLMKYIHSYGPASIKEFAYWTCLKVTTAREIFEGIKDKMEEVKIRDMKGSFLILKKDLDILGEINIKQKLPVRFLPEFDSLLMGHEDKSRILNEEYRKRVFLPLADVGPTILLNGRVVGTWNYKTSSRSFTLSSFEPIEPEDQKEINQESARLKQFLSSD